MMHEILRAYMRRLTNLSGSNRSLLLLRLISDQTLDLHALDHVLHQPSFSIIESLIAQQKSITLCEEADPRNEHINKVSKRLKQLQRIERFIFEERGAKDLYVGWPFVRGKFQDGTMVRCPLLYFPVELRLEKGKWLLKPRQDVNITFNKTFLLAYAYYNETSLPEELIEYVFEGYDKDSRVFRTQLYQILKESPVALNFNQENFMDTLQSFQDFRKADFDAEHGPGVLKSYPEAVLGIFPQAGSYLIPDYMQLQEDAHIQDIEEFFAQRNPDKAEGQPETFRFLKDIKEEETFTAFKLDAYQENALQAVKRGNSLVVQGPPGTGKSQLICNLISDYVARGKKVLVVCQKRAALDVIYERLKEISLHDFLALVHDFKNDRKFIYAQIKEQIDRLKEYEQKNNGLDAVQLERQFLQYSRRIDQITEELEEFKSALFDEKEAGISVKALYLQSNPHDPIIPINQEYRNFSFPEAEEFERKIKALAAYAVKFEKNDYRWRMRKSFADFKLSDLKKIEAIIAAIPEYQQEVETKSMKVLQHALPFEEALTIARKRETVQHILQHLPDEESYQAFQHLQRFQDKDTEPLWLSNRQRIILECFEGVGVEASLSAEEIGRLQPILQEAKRARQQPSQWIRWKLFAKNKDLLWKALEANELGRDRKSLKILEQKLDRRLNLQHNLTLLEKSAWVPLNHWEVDEQYLKGRFKAMNNGVLAKRSFNVFTNFKEYFNVASLEREAFLEKLQAMLEIGEALQQKVEKWSAYLPEQIIQRCTNTEEAQAYLKVLQRDFDALADYDKISLQLTGPERSVWEKLTDEQEDWDGEKLTKLFRNSLSLAWIEHIETKFPILRAVSTQEMDRLTDELQDAIRQKLKISQDILLMKARENTYFNVEYNRLNNRVTYRDLEHQVTKKRKVWPIRKLIQEFQEELFQLIPCWLASPESVSAIFPMESMFDLVIFDEASQCFVERGIPAMYRGKQVVVAGDQMQLSPNDLYKVRWEEDSEEHPELEIESLLDLANKYVMDVQLNGHYRSKSLDLIDFSNQHFYRGKLRLLPDYHVVNKREPAIKYIKVSGTWEKQINAVEARRVIQLLADIFKESPQKEVGVVTFNAAQQGYILDLLDEAVEEGVLKIPEHFFVKNIENVQGDEKDIIIFSTGYAPDEKGRMVMQFGTLNNVKGENRLNVAVTRAREKIYMISSIYPDQLKVEGSKNEGPKLLKKYLQYAREVSEGEFTPQPLSHEAFPVDWYLKRQLGTWLNEEKIQWSEELPFADLTLKQRDRYLGLLLTDDDLYYQNPSVKDAHAYIPFTLSKMNWPFRGLFSRNFWQYREEEMEKITKFFGRLREND